MISGTVSRLKFYFEEFRCRFIVPKYHGQVLDPKYPHKQQTPLFLRRPRTKQVGLVLVESPSKRSFSIALSPLSKSFPFTNHLLIVVCVLEQNLSLTNVNDNNTNLYVVLKLYEAEQMGVFWCGTSVRKLSRTISSKVPFSPHAACKVFFVPDNT